MPTSPSEIPLLRVQDLVICFETETGSVKAVDGISFEVQRGKTMGLVGESGCGKSVSSLSIMRLLPKPFGKITQGTIEFEGIDLVSLAANQMRTIRGNRIAMIFQEPMTALNPVHHIGKQIREIYRLHRPELSTSEAMKLVLAMLKKVGISDPVQHLNEYPHQLSGGMRQRVMIAMALACQPQLLIADEPTTALDVTIQSQILELMQQLQKDSGMSIIFITHDMGVIAEVCDQVTVMYAGKIAEQASVQTLFQHPKHPYTQGLLNSTPRLETPPRTRLKTIEGVVPGLLELPPGCRFYNRCSYATPQCETTPPMLEAVSSQHYVNCLHWKEIASDC